MDSSDSGIQVDEGPVQILWLSVVAQQRETATQQVKDLESQGCK